MNIETHTTPLDMIILYDSIRSGKYAKELCYRLGLQLAPDRKLNLIFWSLPTLPLLPNLAQAAVRDAEHAALLVVSVNGANTLPRSARSCLDSCARGIRAVNGALMAQLYGVLKPNEERCPAYACLKEIAHHAGIRFFSEIVELSDNQPDLPLDAIDTSVPDVQLVADREKPCSEL
jgi:hypothetical protein